MVIATKSAAAHVVTPSVTISMESLKGHRYTKVTPGHHAPDLSFELKPQAVVELMAVVAGYNCVARFLLATGVPLEK